MKRYTEAARELVDILGADGAIALLRLLELSDGQGADCFRQLHERGGLTGLEDALVDVEPDDVLRGWLGVYLRLELGLVC